MHYDLGWGCRLSRSEKKVTEKLQEKAMVLQLFQFKMIISYACD